MTTTTAPKKPRATPKRSPVSAPELDALDRFVKEARVNPLRAIQIMLWRARMQNPDMYVRVNEADLKGFADCVAYLKVKPTVIIHREPGIPAQPGIPASGNRRAVPPREAVAPKPYAVIALVEEREGTPTMNTIRPVENNAEDYDRSLEVAAQRKARDQAPDLAARLLNASRTGDFSSSDLQDAANALVLLSRA
jgi:hypothetical protein